MIYLSNLGSPSHKESKIKKYMSTFKDAMNTKEKWTVKKKKFTHPKCKAETG